MVATPIFAQSIIVGAVTIVPADTSTLKTVYTAGAAGALIDSILVSSSDTSARDLQFWITSGGADYLLCTINIAANAGFINSVALTSILDHARFGATLGLPVFDSGAGNKLFRLGASEVLKVKSLTTVTAAKVIYIRASGTSL